MIKALFIHTWAKKVQRNWDTIYIAVDIHDTFIVANYSTELPTEFCPGAKEVLQRLSQRADTCLILYTCSYPHEIEKYLAYFEQHGIKFRYVNENPEGCNTPFGFFDKKFYFNIVLDDKAGFVPEIHWPEINEALEYIDSQSTKVESAVAS